MSRYQRTAHQLAAIHEIGRHVLVAAGAGSGKTATVVDRLLYLLGVEVAGRTVSAPVPLDRLAAITYTTAAAAELSGALRRRLREAGRRDLAAAVDGARIGTIHRFCALILREFALRRDAAPSVDVLEEGEAQAMADDAARDALLLAVEEGDNGAATLLLERDQRTVHQLLASLIAQGDRLRRFTLPHLGPSEAALVRLARRALGLLEHRLADRGAVDFDRMLAWTRDLIRDDGYARRTLQRRIHTLVVDEFQDVDPVQWELARLLGEPGSGRADTPRLLLVGDPKQSIYRFRAADVTTWRAAATDFADGGGVVVPLSENFRSTAPILDFAAATVGKLLDTPIAPEDGRQPYEIEFTRLEVGLPERQGAGPPVALIAVPAEELGADDVRRVEAEAIARRIVSLHDREGLAWRETALLFSAWTSAEIYLDALRRHGVPAYLRRETGFYARREVLDQIVALEAIRDPYDDRALLGFLRSPFVGVKDETLLAIALPGPGPYWRRLATVSCGESALLRRGAALLERAVALRDRLPTDQLLAELLLHSGYWAHLKLRGEEKDQAAANVRKFLVQTRAAAEHPLGDYLRAIAAQRRRGDRVGDARLHGEEDDVVTLTTIHSAKGLQWEAVFWCDLARGRGADQRAILIGHDQLLLKDPDLDVSEPPDAWQALKAALDAEAEAEAKRLWYVAATRARRYLSLSPFPLSERGAPRDSAARRFAELLGLGPEAPDAVAYPRHGGGTWSATVQVADPALPADTVAAPAAEIPDGADATLAGPLAPIPAPVGPWLHSASEALVFSRCEKKHWFQYVWQVREPAVERSGANFDGAITRGQIVHDVLERLRVDSELDSLIADAIGRTDPDAPAPNSVAGRRERERLRATIERVSADPRWREIADLPGARRELRFVHLTPRGGWQGAFDLAARTEQGQILLDVKTGGRTGDLADAAARYGLQRDVYVAAARAIAGEPVAEFRFHFSEANEQVRSTFSADQLADLDTRLADLAAGMERDAPALTSHPEECRFCGFKGAGWCPGAGG